ncbi:hypothetical protein KY284_027230 [Solanum tuberosum]|nr:hypothetical protein KY284_027230 [Solanum tuberosum]
MDPLSLNIRKRVPKQVTENKGTLTSFTLRSTSKSGSLITIPVDEEVIANTESEEDGQTFSIEVKMSFPSDQKRCYVLVCSNCGQEVRYPIIIKIHCMNCNQHKMLIPRCRFDVNLKDSSGSTTGMIMNKEGEKLLSLTAEQIYERASTKFIQAFWQLLLNTVQKRKYKACSLLDFSINASVPHPLCTVLAMTQSASHVGTAISSLSSSQ